MLHRAISSLSRALIGAFPVSLFWVDNRNGKPYYALKLSAAVPTGTPDAAVAINLAAGAATAARVYVDNAGAWAALS